jgi:hypothetical protein
MQNFDHDIGFWEKRQVMYKSQKIVIITSTPGSFIHKTELYSWSQSYDLWIYNDNVSVVVGQSVFSKWRKFVFVFKTH